MEQVSYKKLFKLLIDKDLKKTEFAAKAGISQNTLKEERSALSPSLLFSKNTGSTRISPVSFSRRQKECLSLPMSIPTKYIKIHPFKNICDVFDTTALKPQNLVQNTNSKTHLTNHCSGIRRGKILSEVVKATGSATNPHSHISIFYRIHQTVINHG